VVEPPLSVSPQDGVAWSVTYRRREEQGAARWSDEVRSALSLYRRLPRLGAFAHPVLALRIAAGASRGPIADRFNVGGVSSGSIGLIFTRLGGPSRAFPVRGYDGAARRGRRAVAASAELRLPIALVGQGLGHLPVGADKLALSLFADVGDAWDPGTAFRFTRLRGVGGELVADLTYAYDLPLRLRFGAATPLGAGPARLYAALGTEF
jgi:outer membrane protein assembly factor BamA